MAKHLIEKQLEKRILILDGAMGTMLQNENLSAEAQKRKKLINVPSKLLVKQWITFQHQIGHALLLAQWVQQQKHYP